MIDFSPVRADARKTYELPPGWRWARLSEVARLESGHTPSRRRPDYWGGDVQWLSLKDIRDLRGRYIHQTADHPTPLGIENSSARVLPQGTVALCRTASVGKTVILGRDMATSQDFVSWICGPLLLPEYLHAALIAAAPEFDRLKQGSTHKTIYMPTVENFLLALPPKDEQERIAEVLDRADALRAKRRAALAELDTLTSSIFVDMFGEPITNSKGWREVRFEQCLSDPLRNGLSPSRSGTVTARVLTLSSVTGSEFDPTAWKTSSFESEPPEDQAVAVEDFLICRGNGSLELVGRGRFPTTSMPDVTFPDTIIAARISGDVMAREFFQQLWNSRSVRSQIERAARTTNGTFKVNQGSLEQIVLIQPPMALQHDFAKRAGTIGRLMASHHTSLAELDALFASLQHRAFRGEL